MLPLRTFSVLRTTRWSMTDSDELRQAIAASGLSARSFAALLEVEWSTVRRWLNGDVGVPGPIRVLSRAILRDPSIIAALAPPN